MVFSSSIIMFLLFIFKRTKVCDITSKSKFHESKLRVLWTFPAILYFNFEFAEIYRSSAPDKPGKQDNSRIIFLSTPLKSML